MQGLAAIVPINLGQAYVCRQLSAAGLSATYVVLYVMASFCLATGAFHPESSHDGQRHQHDHHHHEPRPVREPSSSSAAVTPDLCDFALRVLSTPLWHALPALPIAVLTTPTRVPVELPFTAFSIAAVNSIRAPPEGPLDVA
jgi:hypothetical protein